MKLLIALLSLLPFAVVGMTFAAPASGPKKVFPYEVQRETLPNGLKVLMVPMPSDGLVSYWSVVRTGSRDEVEPGVTGFAHFFEHMMFKGSENYPGGEYDRIVASMGADSNAFTSDDLTAYHLSITKEDLPTVIKIEADRFQRLKYSEAEFKTEAGAVYGEYRKNRTSPGGVLNEAVLDKAFDKHTYKHTVIGFEADIKAMPQHYDYSLSFFKRFYRPENVVLLIVGDFDRAETMKAITAAYGGWAPGYVAPKIEPEPEQTAMRRMLVPFEGKTLPLLSVNWKGEKLIAGDKQMLAGLMMGELAFGETSEIYKKLVLEQQRVESIGPDFGLNRDPNLWSVYAQVRDPADVDAVEAEIWQTVESLQRTPVDPARLADAISRERYGFLTGLATPDGVASSLARFIAISGDINVIDQMYATLESLTPADLQQAAQRYLTRERCTVATIYAKAEPLPAQKTAAVVTAPPLTNPPISLPVTDPNVTIKLWFRAGSQDDPPGKEGLASLTAALIEDGGTTRFPYDEILSRLYPLAAGYGVSVDKEMTVLTASVHRDLVDRFYPLLSDVLLSPGFRSDDFERIKSRRLNFLEKTLRFSSDEELAKAMLSARVFAGTPYAHLGVGTVESLKRITLDDVKQFHAKYYTRDNVTLALGGGFEAGLQARLAADIAQLPAGKPAAVAAPSPKPIAGRQVVLVQKPGESTAISLGYPIDLKRGSKDFYALWIANSWLGEHRNQISHLFQVIREQRGMNYGNYSYIEAFPNGGRLTMPPQGVGRRGQMFEIWIRPVPHDRAIFALRAGLREFDRLIVEGMSQAQFDKQRNFLRKYCLQFATTSGEKLGYAVDDRFFGLGAPGHLAMFRKAMDEMTLADVNAVIKRYFQSKNLVISMVTADANAMKDALVSGKPSPINYGEIKKSKEILAEDKQIEKYPLGIRAEDVTIVPVEQVFQK